MVFDLFNEPFDDKETKRTLNCNWVQYKCYLKEFMKIRQEVTIIGAEW